MLVMNPFKNKLVILSADVLYSFRAVQKYRSSCMPIYIQRCLQLEYCFITDDCYYFCFITDVDCCCVVDVHTVMDNSSVIRSESDQSDAAM